MHKHTVLFSLFLTVLIASAAVADESYPQSVFVASISGSQPDLRPHRAYNADEAQIMTALYEGLFVYDPYTLEPMPGIAESWTVSKDGLEWKFTLRTNARFETGETITAEQVARSWRALLDPAVQAPYASLLDSISGAFAYRTGQTTDTDTIGISALDERTLQVRLERPTEHLSRILCHHAFSIIHPKDMARGARNEAEATLKPLSSGPFKLVSRDENSLVFEKNEHYWDAARVSLPGLVIVISDDPEVLTARFNRGEIHWLAGEMNLSKLADTSLVRVSPMFATEFFFFRSVTGPWSDMRLRNAYLLTIPYAELRAERLIPAKTLVFPISGYPELEGLEKTDPARARELVAEAGIGDPSLIPPLVVRIPDSASYRKIADILVAAWTKEGFPATLEVVPFQGYYASLRKNDYGLGITSWIGDFADPLAFLEMFRPTSTLNDSGWSNETFENLIREASAEKSTEKRYGKLADAERLLLSEGVIIPVGHNPSLNVIDTSALTGWYVNALDIHPFKFIKFIPGSILPGVVMAR